MLKPIESDGQPREHPVPCQLHGVDRTDNGFKARAMTVNRNALCDECQDKLAGLH